MHNERVAASRHRRGLGLALASALAFGMAGPFSKTVLVHGGLSALRLAQLRITGTAVVLVAVASLRRPGRGRTSPSWSRRAVVVVLAYAALGFVGVQLCYFVAIDHLPVGVALLFEYTSVVLVALFAAVVQHRRQPGSVWVGAVLVTVGLVVMTEPWRGFTLSAVGALAGCGAAVGSAGYFLLGEEASVGLPTLELMAVASAAGAAFLALVEPWWSFPFARLERSVPFSGVHPPVWVLVGVVTVVGTVVAYLLGMSALNHLPAPTATVVATLEILVAAVASWGLLGEHLSAAEVGGGAVIFAGVVVVGARSRLGAGAPAAPVAAGGDGPGPAVPAQAAPVEPVTPTAGR